MGRVLSFGELLLRICPDATGNWLEDNQLPFYVGGAEANVATALALWDVPSSYLTALPQNFLSGQLVSYLQKCGIDTSLTHYHGNRIGLYYLPKGKDLKNEGVIYDRNNSAFADLKPGMIDWEKAFEEVSWFHFSAICPAINQAVAEVCMEALKIATKKNITISVDLNYRAKLWQYGKTALDIMPELVHHCNLIMGNVWAAQTMLNIPIEDDLTVVNKKEYYLDQAEKTSKQIIERYPNCQTVANTFRFDYDGGIKYYTALFTEGKMHISKEYIADKIIDKVGSGDCFMAGLIFGFFHKLSPQQTLEFATAAAFNKLFIESDATNQKPEEIKKFVEKYVSSN